MNKMTTAGLSIALIALAGAITDANAQETTRLEVRQELIQAENDGSRFVTDTSYPAVNPIFAEQVARRKAQRNSGIGGVPDSGGTSSHAALRMPAHPTAAPPSCDGPPSFCVPYFGS